jgi:hypothetical protein
MRAAARSGHPVSRRCLVAAAAGGLWALLCGGGALAQTERTPRAGEAYTETVFGNALSVAERDRTRVTEIGLGFQWIADGPEKRVLVPSGGLFFWRNESGGQSRFRALLSGLYDDVRYNRRLAKESPWEVVATFENVTLPFTRSEYVEGERIASEELKWGFLRAGAGIGYRRGLAPGHQDNVLETAITYEPGYLFFSRGDDTATAFLLPRNTYEGRLHVRLRADAFERNILELPHRGWAAGLDAWAGQRSRWVNWGGPVFGIESGDEGASWRAVAVYAAAAAGIPGVASERHTLVASAYGATGRHLDRFSAFRLGGGSNAGDYESLSQPILPAAVFEEFFSSRYGIANLEYRYQALFFLYLQARGTVARLDRPRFSSGGSVENETGTLRAVTAAVTSGFLWDSSLEIAYSRNFDLLRQRNGVAKRGGGALYFFWTKDFRSRR